MRELIVVGVQHVHAVEKVGSFGGAVQQTDDVHQRGLAGTGGTNHGDEFAAVHVKVAAVDDGEFALIANVEAFDNIAHFNKAVGFWLQAVHVLRVLPAHDLGKILCVVTHPVSPAALPSYGSCRGCSTRCHHS